MIRETDRIEELCEEITKKLCEYLDIDRPILTSLTIEDRVCEILAFKITRMIGLRCQYNYKNELINFFSSILGEVVLERLGYNLSVAKNYRFIKYDGINFVHEVARIFDRSQGVNCAVLDSVRFLEEHKFAVSEIKHIFKLKIMSLACG